MQDCENAGTSVCMWRKDWNNGPNLGGCGKIYCEDHECKLVKFNGKSKRTQIRSENGDSYKCCTMCIKEMEIDCSTARNIGNVPSYSDYLVVATAVCSMIWIIVMLIFILFLYL